ncbi:MAG: zinc ribbon domain-containing protein [Prevotella sp.]|jgi:RNA polymerase subunit RPABC4/transcription elongation factor Spt4|nr:zinc ribbon domain-containing protein [Prevotella sp.]MCI2125044.1 zinc ribbon domain-containing protein [Prevotella sp.]
MAIIKCPECGHQISDKAPVCPNCGVEIAGKIIRCPNCGEVYFANEEMCPNCHRPTRLNKTSTQVPFTSSSSAGASPLPPVTDNVPPKDTTENINHSVPPHRTSTQGPVPPRNPSDSSFSTSGGKKKHKKRNYTPLIIAVLIALVALGIMYHFYSTAQTGKEQQDYEYAMKSSDPTVLQSYLNTYPNAPEAHLDSVQNHLMEIKQNDQEWTNAIMRGSKGALEDYLQNHPHSPHAPEARNKIDSLDWRDAQNENTPASYQEYLKEHPQGAFVNSAQEKMGKVQQKELQPEEKQMISALFKTFFQSINSRNDDRATDQVENVMSSFLGKTNAHKEDVASFIHKIWKNDITNMNWRINNDYTIKKQSVGDDKYEYQVQFSARQSVSSTDSSQPTQSDFRINATVSPNGKISSFNMAKVIL